MVDPHDTAEDHDHSVPLVGLVTGAGAGTAHRDTSIRNHCKSSRHNY